METENLSPVDAAPSPSPEAAVVETAVPNPSEPSQTATPAAEPRPSYVKLAMRNMVRKRGKSLQHFFLTTAALLGLLIGLSYLTR